MAVNINITNQAIGVAENKDYTEIKIEIQEKLIWKHGMLKVL